LHVHHPAEIYEKFISWNWEQYSPTPTRLVSAAQSITLTQWLKDWSAIVVAEAYQRMYVAITVDTTDQQASERYNAFLEDVYPNAQALDNALKSRLLESGLQPDGFAQVLKNLRAEAEVFRTENLPLLSQELSLSSEYDKIVGAQTVEWMGKEVTVSQLSRSTRIWTVRHASKPGSWR
jgi:oligoendopeptidase F